MQPTRVRAFGGARASPDWGRSSPPTPPIARRVSALRYFVILNPAAGRGAALRAWPAAQRVLDAAGADYRLEHTAGPGHAVELAARAEAGGWPAVVACGGDGTVHEVANGLLRAACERGGRPRAALGILPEGSGNDFAALAGIPCEPAAAARHLLAARPVPTDVGRVGERFFTNGVGIGLDAATAVEARRIRHLRGLALYALAIVRVLGRFRPPRIRLEVDGVAVADRPLTLVTVANGGRHGGGFWICPQARIDDGALDICVAEALSRPRILRFLPQVMRGAHVGRPEVTMLRGQRVRITSPDALPVHADGEILATAAHELEIEILRGGLDVLR